MFADAPKVVWGELEDNCGDMGHVSKPCVMQSAAGYYIGIAFKHTLGSPCHGLIEPQERLSGYMSREQAEASLADYE